MRRAVLLSSWLTAVLSFGVSSGRAGEDPRILYDRGQYRAAEREALARGDSDVEALAVLARIRALQKRFDEAERLAERAVSLAPQNPVAHVAVATACGLHAQHAGLLQGARLAGRIRSHAERARALDPRDPDALEILIEFHEQAPGFAGGDRRRAAALLDSLAVVDPARAWLRRGDTAVQRHDSTAALAAFRRAAAVVPADGGARVQLAAYEGAPWRDPAHAESLVRDVLAREPWRTSAWSVLAQLQARAGSFGALDSTLSRATRATGAEGATYQAGRVLLLERRDGARAEALFRRYLASPPEVGAPTEGAAHWRLGLALEQQGRAREALAEVETAVRLDEELTNARKDRDRLKRAVR